MGIVISSFLHFVVICLSILLPPLSHTMVCFYLDGDVFPAIALILVEHSDITRLRFANCHHTKVEMISG